MSTDWLKRSGALLSILLFSGQVAHPLTGGQDTTVELPSKAAHGPTLAETIAFMDRSVKPENSYVSTANHCEVNILRNNQRLFGLPQSTYVKSTDSYGVKHYGFKWLIIKDDPRVIRFSFAEIDPASINSRVAPSPEFIGKHDLDANPKGIDNSDLTVVWFNARNSEKSIETGHFKQANDTTPTFDREGSMEFIVFESKDRAERFVTAFVHAVELCGGTPSDFAPTPSKP
jgi:hypothetical protein